MSFFSKLFKPIFGGGGGKAVKEAQAAEEERQAAIDAANKRIAAIFGGPERQKQYEDFVAATKGYYQTELDKQKVDADRQLRFAIARSGLSGGSADVDQNRRLAENYFANVLGIGRQAESAGEQLKAQDQQTQQALFAQVLSGLDVTTAEQQALFGAQSNIAGAKADAFQTQFGNLFGDFADIYKASKEAAGERRAQFDIGSIYGSRDRQPAYVAGGIYG